MSATGTVSRARIARRKVDQLGSRLIQRGNVFSVYSATEGTVFTGSLRGLEKFLTDTYQPAPCGPDRATIPPTWQPVVRDYCTHLTGIGRAPGTVRAHRLAVGRIGREIRCTPGELTAARLVAWFAAQGWKPETRRHYVSAARSFVTWAYKAGVLAEHLADDLPSIRIPASTPRPVPDPIWTAAMATADDRLRLMLRLAGEVGLRRAEVAKVHVRDVLDGIGGAQLVVHGKAGRLRVVPIANDLAAVLRLGAAGHTPAMAAYGSAGYLFPGNNDGHLSPMYVGKLVAAALPPGWSMHKLRHRFASRAHAHGGNLLAVRQLLGHSSVATTQRYCAVDDNEVRAAAMHAAMPVHPPSVASQHITSSHEGNDE